MSVTYTEHRTCDGCGEAIEGDNYFSVRVQLYHLPGANGSPLTAGSYLTLDLHSTGYCANGVMPALVRKEREAVAERDARRAAAKSTGE